MIRSLDVSLAKTSYLLSYTTPAGQGGDKRTFWRSLMGFDSADDLRTALLDSVAVDSLRLRAQTAYGDLYEATSDLTSPTGTTRRIRTGWIVRSNEDVARFVTGYPDSSRSR